MDIFNKKALNYLKEENKKIILDNETLKDKNFSLSEENKKLIIENQNLVEKIDKNIEYISKLHKTFKDTNEGILSSKNIKMLSEYNKDIVEQPLKIIKVAISMLTEILNIENEEKK